MFMEASDGELGLIEKNRYEVGRKLAHVHIQSALLYYGFKILVSQLEVTSAINRPIHHSSSSSKNLSTLYAAGWTRMRCWEFYRDWKNPEAREREPILENTVFALAGCLSDSRFFAVFGSAYCNSFPFDHSQRLFLQVPKQI